MRGQGLPAAREPQWTRSDGDAWRFPTRSGPSHRGRGLVSTPGGRVDPGTTTRAVAWQSRGTAPTHRAGLASHSSTVSSAGPPTAPPPPRRPYLPESGGVPTAPPPEGTGPAPTSQREGPAVAPGPRPVGRAHGRAHSYRPQAICVGPRAPVTVQHGGGGPMPRSEGSLPCPARAPRGPSGTASEHSSPPAVRTTDHAAQAHAPLDARWSRSQRKWTVTARDRTVAQGQREHVGRRGRSRLCLTDSSAPAIRLLGPGLPPARARTAMGICRPLGWGRQGLSTRARWAGMAEEHGRPDPGPPGPLRCPGPGG